MIPTLAIDPGHDGAAVLYDGRRALGRWAWKEVQRDNQPAWWFDVGGHGAAEPNLHCVGEALLEQVQNIVGEGLGAYRLAVEGLFLNPKEAYPGGGASLQELAWSAALVAGPLLVGAEGEVYRPLASQWRPRILGVPGNASADAAAKAALRLVPTLVPGLGVLAGNEHVCEAAAIARWAWVQQRERAA